MRRIQKEKQKALKEMKLFEKEDKILLEKEKKELDIVHSSIEYGKFSIEISIPNEKVQLSTQGFSIKRNEERKLIVEYDVQDLSVQEQVIDEI